jgi:hypothetical protein
MSQGKGAFVIRNAVGTVTMAGVAAIINSNNSAGLTNSTTVNEHKDSAGIPRSLSKDYNVYELSFDLTPGIGGTFGNKGALQAAFIMIDKGTAIETSGFDVTSYNWAAGLKAIVWDCSLSLSQEALGTMRVTARRYTDLAGNPVDFTAAWQTL